MKVLVTGSGGFIGKNLCWFLKQSGYEVLEFDRSNEDCLEKLVSEADFVMHLAGVNRPISNAEFYSGNRDLTERLVDALEADHRYIPLLLSSSIQAERENDYGRSKKAAEDLVFAYGKTGASVFVFRLENAFGKWCRPNYNSVAATFCYNIAHDLPIQISDPEAQVSFVYIDDICKTFIQCIGRKGSSEIFHVNPIYPVRLKDLSGMLHSFRNSRENRYLPDLEEGFEKKLYSTYLSYLPENQFAYPLESHADARGSFTEFVKSPDRGQVSVNISKPGITKGNHWHHTKNEKFLVVKGEAVIRFRKVGTEKIYEYPVSGEKLMVVDIPTGYTHSIENTGTEDLITIMWANEPFDPADPDTFFEEVLL